MILSLAVLALNGCTKRASDLILAEIGPERLTVRDYERMLMKNNGSWEAAKSISMEEKEKFLNLVVKFRLKLLEAYQRGLDKDPEILKEMEQYKASLAANFLLDREVVKPGLRQLYKRRKEEVRASHILHRLSAAPTPEDTLDAWQKAVKLIKLAQRGEDFANLADEYSDDYATRQNGGDVYYFTAGFMVPAFEDACYHIQPGEIFPNPVRTQDGYHVIKVTDRKPNRGQIRASHIMIRLEGPTASPEDTLRAYNAIRALQDSLRVGRDFGVLATDHSEDQQSALQGGDLGFFERRRAVQPFDEAAFLLKVGEVSDIVRTPFGYHLIKVTGEKPVPSYREMKETLRDLYQNSRYTYDYERFLDEYKRSVGFQYYDDVLDTLLGRVDSTKLFQSESWDQDISSSDRQKVIFSFRTETANLDSVIEIMKKDPEFQKLELKRENIHNALERIAERLLFRYRTRNIEAEFPEFKRTLKEYEEGVLLYKSEQQEVWSKISTSDSLLQDYFEKHRERYKLPDRVNFSEIYIMGDSIFAHELLDSLRAGVDFGDLATRYTQRPRMKAKKGEWGFQPVEQNDLTREAARMEVGEMSPVLKFEGGYSIIKVTGREQARLKTYDEALPELTGDYHEDVSSFLEGEWIKALRKEFKVTLRSENLKATFAEPPRGQEE